MQHDLTVVMSVQDVARIAAQQIMGEHNIPGSVVSIDIEYAKHGEEVTLQCVVFRFQRSESHDLK